MCKNFYLGLRQLLVAHGTIAGTEVDCLRQNLPDSSTAADGLIVDLDIGMSIVVLVEPLGIHRIGESCARSV